MSQLIEPTLLLNIFQSAAERAPVVEVLAILMPNTHVVLLYVSGPVVERFARDIFVHWSFSIAERTVSVATTEPDDAENPVRVEPIARALVK